MSFGNLTKCQEIVMPFTGKFLTFAVHLSPPNLWFRFKKVSLLRSRLGQLAFDEILKRFFSLLPPLFASGRFATFLFSAR